MNLNSGTCFLCRYDKYYQTPRVWLTGYDEVCFIHLIVVKHNQTLLTCLYGYGKATRTIISIMSIN